MKVLGTEIVEARGELGVPWVSIYSNCFYLHYVTQYIAVMDTKVALWLKLTVDKTLDLLIQTISLKIVSNGMIAENL